MVTKEEWAEMDARIKAWEEWRKRKDCRHDQAPADVRYEDGKPKWYCGSCGTFLHA